MSMNAKVEEAKMAMRGKKGTELKEANEHYWKVLETELTLEPNNGWIELEQSWDDVLEDCINNDFGTDSVVYALSNYNRFWDVCDRAGYKGWNNGRDYDLIRRAKEYLAA